MDEFNYGFMYRDKFIYYLRFLFMRIGLNNFRYVGDFFRIGVVIVVVVVGVEDYMIKDLGRWFFDCYVRYIRIDFEVFKDM